MKRGNPDKIKHDQEITLINNIYVLKTDKIFEFLTNLLNKANRYGIIDFRQKFMAHGVIQMACNVVEDHDANIVAVSGEVFANECISNYIQKYMEKSKFNGDFFERDASRRRWDIPRSICDSSIQCDLV
jgi:hydrogenase maturation factor HypF (carbamoyltransferase family)